MNKKSLTTTAALLLCCSSIPLAHAASNNPWYAGIMFGSAISSVSQNQVDTITNDLNTALAPSGNSVTGTATLSASAASAFSLFGGYRVNRYFAGELGYINFGSLGATYTADTTLGSLTMNGTDKAQAFSVSALGTLPITHTWGVFARAGLAHYWETQSTTSSVAGFTVSSTSSDSGMSAVYGFGSSWRIGATTLRVEYDLYPRVAKDFTSVSGGVSVFGLSGQYAF